ncbi:MAG: sulfurtransferase complex subunit TusD [Buchnera aphidicola (Chaetogeoica yunlongensis)]
MNYTILVTGAPYGTQNSTTALLFCNALVASKNRLLSAFFYCDGVLNANGFISFSSDEYDLVRKWVILHKQHSVKLFVCMSAASRRGVVDVIVDKQQDNILKKSNLRSSFILTGLSKFSDYLEISDRIIRF